MSVIQSVLFNKNQWTVPAAKKWLKEHKLKYGKVDTTDRYHRFRQRQPSGRMRIHNLGKGISFIYAFSAEK